MMQKWLKTLIEATRTGDSEIQRDTTSDYEEAVEFDPEGYASQVYRKDDASLGMPEVKIEEDAEWSFEGEVYDQHDIEVTHLHIRHEPGIQAAKAAGIDLRLCFACRLDIRTPNVTPDSLSLLTTVFPAQRWVDGRRYWHLGFDHYEAIRAHGTHAVTVFLTSRRLTEKTYSGPGITEPPTVLRLQHYPLHSIITPSWIYNERTPGPGAEL
jgi:hypothetical protein